MYIDRALQRKGIYPPINPLPSLSRLMKELEKGRPAMIIPEYPHNYMQLMQKVERFEIWYVLN